MVLKLACFFIFTYRYGVLAILSAIGLNYTFWIMHFGGLITSKNSCNDPVYTNKRGGGVAGYTSFFLFLLRKHILGTSLSCLNEVVLWTAQNLLLVH